jgi:hypothetical protein
MYRFKCYFSWSDRRRRIEQGAAFWNLRKIVKMPTVIHNALFKVCIHLTTLISSYICI